MSKNVFEISFPTEASLQIDLTDKSLYSYDFNSYSLVQLQKVAAFELADSIREKFLSHISEVGLIKKMTSEDEMNLVADLSELAKEKLKTGEWVLGIRKETGETYANLREVATGHNKGFINLKEKELNDLGNLPELSAIQGQLTSISEQIERMNHLVERVEQGQYNDRYAGFYSARQLVVEALAAKNDSTKSNLLLESVKTNNDTIAKLMLTLHHDVQSFIDIATNNKDAKRINKMIQNSMGYLNASVQLNLVSYTALGEKDSLMATLVNYQSFIEQTLLNESDTPGKSVAWRIDNFQKGTEGTFAEISTGITNKIANLIDTSQILKTEEYKNEKIENKNMHRT